MQFNDGTVGIYDTKSGITIATAANKSDGLLTYIRGENAHRTNGKLKGGIVKPHGNGQWKIYDGKGADINNPDSPGWKWLKL